MVYGRSSAVMSGGRDCARTKFVLGDLVSVPPFHGWLRRSTPAIWLFTVWTESTRQCPAAELVEAMPGIARAYVDPENSKRNLLPVVNRAVCRVLNEESGSIPYSQHEIRMAISGSEVVVRS